MLFVAQIRDNLLGQVDAVDTISDGIELVKKILIENEVELTEEIIDQIDNDLGYVYTDENDHTNSWSVFVGQTE